jgi:hypothetical protein
MNANELANLLEVDSWYKLVTREEIATMLRHQQAEIEALKKEAALQRLSDFTQEAESFDRTASHMAGEYVAYKAELTDEEIFDVAGEFPFIENGTERLNFARAILRKANEK